MGSIPVGGTKFLPVVWIPPKKELGQLQTFYHILWQREQTHSNIADLSMHSDMLELFTATLISQWHYVILLWSRLLSWFHEQ